MRWLWLTFILFFSLRTDTEDKKQTIKNKKLLEEKIFKKIQIQIQLFNETIWSMHY